MQTNRIDQLLVPTNTVLHGDCISIMRSLPANSIDFILTDPPYLVRYQDREGRSIQNDSNTDWLIPAFTGAYRVLKQDHFMISFYGWTQIDKFIHSWRSAGFRIVGHLVFRNQYASKSRFLRYQHEQAYLLAKGNPALPENPIVDVINMPYSGNKLHPTQKPVAALKPLIEAFTQPGELVLDPSAVRARHYWPLRSSTAAISASNSILGTMQPLKSGCILMTFVRMRDFTRRRWGRHQGPCRQSAVRCKLQWHSSMRFAALTPALRRSLAFHRSNASRARKPETWPTNNRKARLSSLRPF